MFARLALPAVLAGIAFTPAAQAQAPPAGCLQPKEIAKRLSDQFAERPVAYGMQANGTLMQIFAAEDGSTWTVVMTHPSGVSCIVADGVLWEPIRKEPSGPAA
jgi:hypothetical protein